MIDAVQLARKLQLEGEIARIPVSGQTMQNRAVGIDNKHLNVMGSGTIGGINSVAVHPVAAGIAGVMFAHNIAIAAHEVVLQLGICRL